MNIHGLRAEHVKACREGWEDDNYVKKINGLRSSSGLKYRLLGAYYSISPFTSIDDKINELVQKDELQEEIVDDLREMESAVEEFQKDLQKWRDISGDFQ